MLSIALRTAYESFKELQIADCIDYFGEYQMSLMSIASITFAVDPNLLDTAIQLVFRPERSRGLAWCVSGWR